MNIPNLIHEQKVYFKNQETKDFLIIKKKLQKLRSEIKKREIDISDALYKDFKKSEFESYVTEIGIILAELDLAIKKIK